jgi:MFS family permease
MKQKEGQNKELTEEKLKEETKKLSIREGIAANVMDGAGVTYIPPYALAIGANNAQIGFLTSIPALLGSLSQLFSARAIEKYSRKRIIVTGVFLQALMWIPIILVGYLFFYKNLNHGASATLLIVFYTLFTLFGAFLSPAWNSLMKDTITKGNGAYFGRRNKINGAVSLIVMLICGFILHYTTEINLFLGFAILFGIALISRLVSSYLLTKHHDPELKFEKGYYFTIWQFIRKIPKSNFGKFTVFVSLFMLATYIASPFFTVYMLKTLNFSYATWALITISGMLSAFLFMSLWGKFSDKFGNLKIMRMTGGFIPLIPLLWLLTPFLVNINPALVIVYLLITEFISNFIWAGFNLSVVNFIYDAVTKQRLALCVAYYNIFRGVGVFIGATLGGILASANINLWI